jgi:antitoxin (DNA-binding transcriptional repressor) of toxin-antitoxin stability system
MSMAGPIIHISEEEAARDFAALLVRVRAGAEVVIEHNSQPVAVVHPTPPVRRSISESIALAKEHAKKLGYTPTLDAGFAADLEDVINSHREPLNPPAWD